MSDVLSYLSKHPRDSQGIFGEDQRRSPTDRKCKKSLSSTFFCEICPSGVHGMWFAKFTCASHLAASVEGCWIGMLAFLQTLALSSGPQGHSFSHFITIAVDVAFQTWSARPMQGVFGLPTATATDEKMWQRNPALLSLRPLFLPFLPADALRPEMHLESRLSQAVRFPAASSSGCRPEDLDAESGDEKQRLLVESSQHQQIAFSGLNMVKFRLVHF